ncbi:Choline O-acetyltransferase [Labeo rohita]|uniref:Choline O-acetyltransferase n=1 Tax=Labeo rohita TaxID=84645 RepID=A0ABQ8L5Q1_LABRO|nr:Choline O-acetyltransferase [Labeo rohita]
MAVISAGAVDNPQADDLIVCVYSPVREVAVTETVTFQIVCDYCYVFIGRMRSVTRKSNAITFIKQSTRRQEQTGTAGKSKNQTCDPRRNKYTGVGGWAPWKSVPGRHRVHRRRTSRADQGAQGATADHSVHNTMVGPGVRGAMAQSIVQAAMLPTVHMAMVGQGVQEAMAEYTVHSAMAGQGVQEAMAEYTVHSAMAGQGVQEAMAEYTVHSAMAD